MPWMPENQTVEYDESGGKGAEEGPGAMQNLYMCQLWQEARGVGRSPSPWGYVSQMPLLTFLPATRVHDGTDAFIFLGFHCFKLS